LRPSTLKKVRVIFDQIRRFSTEHGLVFIKQWDVSLVRRFRESWLDGSVSAVKKLERTKAFFRYAHDSGWLNENPAAKLKNPRFHVNPTLPFTTSDMGRILTACNEYAKKYGAASGSRARAFILFLRYSGLRIGDAACCAKAKIEGMHLLLYTH